MKQSRLLSTIACGALAAAILVAYWPMQYNGFVNLDDHDYVLKNPHVLTGLGVENIRWAFTTFHSANWHPVTWISHMADVSFFGLDAPRHHLVSLVFHILNSLLVLFVLREMTGAFWRSLLVAALFALHPINVESVAWISERKNLLSAFFWWLSVLAYVGYARHGGRGRYSLLLLLFCLSLLSKPMAVTLPIILLLCDYWPLRRTVHFRTLVAEKIPLLAMSVAVGIVAVISQSQGQAITGLGFTPIGLRCENAVVSCAAYVRKLLWPADLAAYYPYVRDLGATQVLVAAVLCVAAAWIAVRSRSRHPYVGFGLLWFAITLFPVLGLLQVGAQAMADRYMYVPAISLFCAAVWATERAVANRRSRRVVIAVVCVGVCASLGFVTRSEVGSWRDSVSLFRNTLRRTEGNFYVRYCMGNAFIDEREYDSAEIHLREALDIEPRFELAHYPLGLALYYQGRRAEALDTLHVAEVRTPGNANVYHVIGWIYRDWGQDSLACVHYRRAIDIDPVLAEVNLDLGTALGKQGRSEEAIAAYEQELRNNPRLLPTYVRLASLLCAMDRPREAARVYLRAERLCGRGNPVLAAAFAGFTVSPMRDSLVCR